MENPIYIKTMEQTAANFSELNTELSNIAKKMKSIELYNPQTQLFSLVRIAEPNTVQLRNLAARTVVGDSTLFNSEVSNILGISVEETHDWIKIIVPAILPKRNQRDSQAFLAVPLRNALRDFLNKNPMERFYKCAICIVHQYDVALGTMRIRDYDNIETKRYLDVIEAFLLTNDGGLLCTVLQCTEVTCKDATEFYLMLPETLPKWLQNRPKNPTDFC